MRDPFATAADNLTLWHEAAAENRELCLLQAEQLGRDSAHRTPREIRELARQLFTHFHGAQDAAARAALIGGQIAFLQGLLQNPPPLLGEGADGLLVYEAAPAAPRVVFLDSFFGREALHRFEALLPHARPVTAPSFTAVCEELASGRADFALLPLEDSREGRFLHLFEEIDRFELHVTHTCEVPYTQEGRTVLMGLLSRLYTPTQAVTGDQLLSCTLLQEEAHALSDLLLAAEYCRLTLRRVDTLPTSFDEDRVIHHLSFAVLQPRDELLFRTYLELFLPRACITERYLHLKEH